MCCKEHQSTSYIASAVMLYIQQQGCVDVSHDANMITFSSGNSSITQMARCFIILFWPASGPCLLSQFWGCLTICIRNVRSCRHPEQSDAFGWFLSSELVTLSVCARCLVVSLDLFFCARQLRFSMTAIKKWSLCLWTLLSVTSTPWSGFRCY